jgi:hypothetical protein
VLPFGREQFDAVFASYNAGVWPIQVIAYIAGLIAVAMLLLPSRASSRVVGAILAAMWLWTGVVYHGMYFAAINKAALAFGAFFVLQGIGLMFAGATGRLLPSDRRDGCGALGWAFVIYAAIVYPLIGMASGHAYPELPMFGITPCPVTIFTFGVLLLARASAPGWLLPIPFVWSVIGGSAAFLLGVPQDWLLLASGIATVTVVRRFRRTDTPVAAT